MRGAKVTPCCSRRNHRTCYQRHVATSDCCGHFRAPFEANPAGVPNRKQQRQQAIRDLEALLEPGAIEDWITQIRGRFIRVSEGLYQYNVTLIF